MQRVPRLLVQPRAGKKQIYILSIGRPLPSKIQSSPNDSVPRKESSSQSKAIKHTSLKWGIMSHRKRQETTEWHLWRPALCPVTLGPQANTGSWGGIHIHAFKILNVTIWGSFRGIPVAQMVKYLPSMWATWFQSLGWKDPLEEGMATHSSILVLRIPWTEESGRLQFMGSQRVGHNWMTFTSGNSGVKTSPSNVGGAGLIPDQGAKIPLRPKNKNIKQKQYYTKFNRDFENGPHPPPKKIFKKCYSFLHHRFLHFNF